MMAWFICFLDEDCFNDNINYCSGLFFRYCLLSGAVKQKSKDLDGAGSLQSYSSVIKIGAMRLPKHPCLSLTFLAGWPFSYFQQLILYETKHKNICTRMSAATLHVIWLLMLFLQIVRLCNIIGSHLFTFCIVSLCLSNALKNQEKFVIEL